VTEMKDIPPKISNLDYFNFHTVCHFASRVYRSDTFFNTFSTSTSHFLFEDASYAERSPAKVRA
jgi:hypothetical protein